MKNVGYFSLSAVLVFGDNLRMSSDYQFLKWEILTYYLYTSFLFKSIGIYLYCNGSISRNQQ